MGKPNFFCGIEGLQWLLQKPALSNDNRYDYIERRL